MKTKHIQNFFAALMILCIATLSFTEPVLPEHSAASYQIQTYDINTALGERI